MTGPRISPGTIAKFILYAAITIVVPGGAVFGGYQIFRLIKERKAQKDTNNGTKITTELQDAT